jgi:hypothetical protein
MMKSPQIGVIIVYMSDCHSVRASKIILLHVFTFVLIIQRKWGHFCPQDFAHSHFAHTKKANLACTSLLTNMISEDLGDFLWAKSVGKMKMCGQNNVVGWCECRWKSCLSWSRGLASSWWVWRVALDPA